MLCLLWVIYSREKSLYLISLSFATFSSKTRCMLSGHAKKWWPFGAHPTALTKPTSPIPKVLATYSPFFCKSRRITERRCFPLQRRYCGTGEMPSTSVDLWELQTKFYQWQETCCKISWQPSRLNQSSHPYLHCNTGPNLTYTITKSTSMLQCSGRRIRLVLGSLFETGETSLLVHYLPQCR